MRKVVVKDNDSGKRIDSFLEKTFPNLPKSLMYKEIRKKNIKVNGKRVEISYRLHTNDNIDLYVSDEFLDNKPNNFYEYSVKYLEFIYEDTNIVLIYKPNGLLSQKDENGFGDTAENRLRGHLIEKSEYDPENENSFVPSLCNRLDRNTEGILIAAKNAEALRVMNEKIKNRELEKRYLCMTVGVPPKKQAVLTAYHVKDEKNKKASIYDSPAPGRKEIKTEYRVIDDNGEFALVEILLHTGRTHQIRAHMAHIGYPLLGDSKYGNFAVNKKYGIKSQKLCAYKLKFAFTSDAGILNYLNGKEFEVKATFAFPNSRADKNLCADKANAPFS
ncbi:MAG: RluA family pseudouridine synthase [Ruminococcus sp.]|jgi:23S rRNA pseudouridine955/2504/2580 synthase|nr:RluA family pseudouridine synthase [Ruminococcus sp.]